jgi:hypothetical protein
VCVHDRQRNAPGRPPITVGVWLSQPPLLLGAMGCGERVDAVLELGDGWKDVRVDEPHARIANDWRGAATLVASQGMLALLPV